MAGSAVRVRSRRRVRRTGQRLQLTAVVERDRFGYVATCPQLQGCYTQGQSYEEVVRNIRTRSDSTWRTVWRTGSRCRNPET